MYIYIYISYESSTDIYIYNMYTIYTTYIYIYIYICAYVCDVYVCVYTMFVCTFTIYACLYCVSLLTVLTLYSGLLQYKI